MGIRGLTTFIQSRSHLYMDKYKLHDTSIVIDGMSIACQLYRWHCPGANDCFGGDYDRYGIVVLDFFQLLLDCNITPYVIFDGGYEDKKSATVMSRMKNKISTAAALDSVTEGSHSVFPLFLRNCFEEILCKLGVKKVRCDFEGDTEIANIAKHLNCPVLSYDSDFFIFDILYIPFSTIEMKVKIQKIDDEKSFKYISCEVYRIDKFLNSYGGMDKTNLPLLAVLLGNDYVRRSVFKVFFQNLKIQKCQKNQNEQQKRIKSLIVWLQNETKESAIRKVLCRYKKINRRKIFDKIKNAIQGYFCSNSNYTSYLGIEVHANQTLNNIEFEQIVGNNMDSDSEGESEDYIPDTDFCLDDFEVHTFKGPKNFLENFRTCKYPPCFMDIISKNRYYCMPQVENIKSDHSHKISFEILGAIHKILTGSRHHFICFTRIFNIQVGKETIPFIEKEVPHFSNIEFFSKKKCEDFFLNIIDINDDIVCKVLNNFPKSWYLYIFTICYFINKVEVSWPMIYSLIISKIYLEYLDEKTAKHKKKKSFDKQFAGKLKEYQDKPVCMDLNDNISDALSAIYFEDCIYSVSKLIMYFEIEEKMKSNHKLFDRNVVHSIAQFQSCLLHVKYLNSLLNDPFLDIIITKTLNCTFIYNLTVNLKKRNSCDNYLDLLLGSSQTVNHAIKLVINVLKDCFQNINIVNTVPKRRKKKKKITTLIIDEEVSEESCDNLCEFDPNNKFSLLSL